MKPTNELLEKLQEMLNHRKLLTEKMLELELTIGEHKTIINVLSEIKDDRKVFRLVGDIMIERNAKEIALAVDSDLKQMTGLLNSLNSQIDQKSSEIKKYIEENDLRNYVKLNETAT